MIHCTQNFLFGGELTEKQAPGHHRRCQLTGNVHSTEDS